MPLKLPRFDRNTSLVKPDGTPTVAFHRWWHETVGKLEQTFDALEEAVFDIQTALDAAIQAQEDADEAQSDATASAREAARINSYTAPTSVLSAADAGSDATVTILDHTRVYPVQGSIDIPDVSVTGGDITGLAYATKYYIYYDDETLESETPVFATTTVMKNSQVGAAAGRHYLGAITTPSSGGGGTSGVGTRPPGGGSGEDIP